MEETIIKRDYFDTIKADFLTVAGVTEGEFLKEIGFAIQQIKKTPMLQKASRPSIYEAIMNVAQIKLSLNPITQETYLIPRYNRKTSLVEAALEPSYKGLMKLLTDSKTVKSIEVRLVYEGEECVIDFAHPNKVVKHIPLIFEGKKLGAIKGAYSLATLHDGEKHIEVMSLEQVHDCRAVSESYKAYLNKKIPSCIWVEHEPEMIRKTVIKRHFKFLPKSGALEKIHKAIDLDNKIHGVRELIKDSTVDYCLRLIGTSSLEEHIKVDYETQLLDMKYGDEAYPILKALKDSQLNPITEGRAYSATDITAHLKEIQKNESPKHLE